MRTLGRIPRARCERACRWRYQPRRGRSWLSASLEVDGGAPLSPGQDDPEKAAFRFLALQFDAAAVRRDRPQRDGETEARAARFPGPAGVRPVEALEDPLVVRGRNPRAGVLHLDRGLPGSGRLGPDVD